jgi:hypothetical protein
MRTTTLNITRTLACLLTAGAVLAGCGGGDKDLTGDAKVPDGYKQYTENGVSFVYPSGWQVGSNDTEDGPTIEITPSDKTKTPYGLIQLSMRKRVTGDRFKSLADQRRIVYKDVNDAKIGTDEKVTVDGAKEALRLTATAPPGDGSDPAEVKSDSLDVLASNDDMFVLTAATPDRDDLDVHAVVDSFRVTG